MIKRTSAVCLIMFFVVTMGFYKPVSAGQPWLPVNSGDRFVESRSRVGIAYQKQICPATIDD